MAKDAKQRPFLAQNGFNLASPLTVRVRLKSGADGEAGVAWRTKDQKDFPKDQTAPFNTIPSPDRQDLETTLTADHPIIHLRLLLPAGDSTIESIKFKDAQGATLKSWDFKN